MWMRRYLGYCVASNLILFRNVFVLYVVLLSSFILLDTTLRKINFSSFSSSLIGSKYFPTEVTNDCCLLYSSISSESNLRLISYVAKCNSYRLKLSDVNFRFQSAGYRLLFICKYSLTHFCRECIWYQSIIDMIPYEASKAQPSFHCFYP